MSESEDRHAMNRRLAARRLADLVWRSYASLIKDPDDDVKISEALDRLSDRSWDTLAYIVQTRTPVSAETKALVKELILARERGET